MRVAEAYLNMAEACAMLNDAEACDWLNRLRRNRISEYVDMQYSGEELVDEIRNEQRKSCVWRAIVGLTAPLCGMCKISF